MKRIKPLEFGLVAVKEFRQPRRKMSQSCERACGELNSGKFARQILSQSCPNSRMRLSSIRSDIQVGIMRIDRIRIRNFKGFKEKSLDLNPRFTLLVGDNGAGKTTLLDALAVASGVWLVKPPDSTLAGSARNILREEIRLEQKREGDRSQFYECKPVTIEAGGEIVAKPVKWLRQIRTEGSRTSNADAKAALDVIGRHYSRIRVGDKLITPVIAYYGTGRSRLPHRSCQLRPTTGRRPARRWEAFYDCFAERIRLGDLQNCFQREAIAFAGKGRWRPGFVVVKGAGV